MRFKTLRGYFLSRFSFSVRSSVIFESRRNKGSFWRIVKNGRLNDGRMEGDGGNGGFSKEKGLT